MTAAAAVEIDRMVEITGQKTADLFRQAFYLLSLYVNEISNGKEVMIVDPRSEGGAPTKVELIFQNPVRKSAKQSRTRALNNDG